MNLLYFVHQYGAWNVFKWGMLAYLILALPNIIQLAYDLTHCYVISPIQSFIHNPIRHLKRRASRMEKSYAQLIQRKLHLQAQLAKMEKL